MTDDNNTEGGSESPAPGGSADEHPTHIGPYRILDVLGEGGMAVVYLAQQSEPLKRRVALKILKLGMDSKQVVARFESERQALAVLDHPNIAKIFDGGLTDTGRPYFVMEWVQGIPVTDYCDQHRLTTNERVELFETICSAVQHAHHKALIHRDLKPSNILVSVVDEKPQAKIIDFGIAKATSINLTEQTLVTKIGQVIGTPQYMSPEQADITGLDVDTRTDVYSLGVVLYELLVGVVPLDLTAVAEQAVRVALREKDPPKPSTRITELGDTGEEIAKARHTNSRHLRRQLKGDLDWIAMKAMEKDRTRRYATVNGLALDLGRYLEHKSVTAGSPSIAYRMSKFVRRHRLGVASAAAVLVAIIAGSVLATVGMVRAQRAEQEAAAEAATSKAINDFLQETLGAASPWRGGQGRDVTILEALGTAVSRIDEAFDDQPLVAAALQNTIGRTYLRLGSYELADPLLRSSLDIRRSLLEEEHKDVAESLQYLGVLRLQQDIVGEAEQHLTQALNIYRELFGDSHPRTVETLADYSLLLLSLSRYEEAIQLNYEILDHRRVLYGDEHIEVALGLNDQGWAHLLADKLEESERFYRDAIAMYGRLLEKARPQESVAIQNWLNLSLANLATSLRLLGRLDESEAVYRQVIEANSRLLGDVHPRIAGNLTGLAAVITERGEDLDAAMTLHRQAVDMQRQIHGDNSAKFASSLVYLANAILAQGDHRGAAATNLEALEIFRDLASEGNGLPSWYASTANNVGFSLLSAGDCEEALPYFVEAVEQYEDMPEAKHAGAANSRSHYGACLTELERYEEAEAALQAAYPVLRAERGDEHEWTTRVADRLADLYETWGKPDKADEYRPRSSQP